ncbi:MAG: methyltransferase domain-containing protein [Candidatus Aminicenantes bacterium]|nr:methyltransferase domain-containing protein [Candidatus Aminicenantes bacterium]
MCEYLDTSIDLDDPEIVSAMDDLPLWSAPFALTLLEHIRLRPNIKVLDIGFGSGFPLLELAQSLGPSCTVYGLDPCAAAHDRVRLKIKVFDIKNVKLIVGDASAMDFDDSTFDLIVSNLGVNNFSDPQKIFDECFRVAKPGAQIALTTNPKGHMKEFYEIFEKVLEELRLNHVMDNFVKHINHRMTVETIRGCLTRSGFRNITTFHDTFLLRYLNGSTFLRHPLIRYGFLDDWKKLVPLNDRQKAFRRLEDNLNQVASKAGELRLTVPIACIDAEKLAAALLTSQQSEE